MKIKKKILKNFLIQQILGFIIATYIFFIKFSIKIKHKNLSIPQKFWSNGKPFILAFWHSQLMTISFCWKCKKKLNILASSHSDGRLGSIIASYFNIKNIPITSNQNIIEIRNIFKTINKKNYIGITPDGPRGPKENVSEGIIKIARATNIPIISCGFWSSQNFNLKSWDSFLVTLPFSSCCFVWNEPLYIAKDIKDDEIIQYQELLKKMIDESINKAKKNI